MEIRRQINSLEYIHVYCKHGILASMLVFENVDNVNKVAKEVHCNTGKVL